MLLKICLIIALITGLAAIGIGFLKVEPRIKTAESDLETTKQSLAAETSAKQQLQTKLTATEGKLTSTKAELDQTKGDLAAKSTALDQANQSIAEKDKTITAKDAEIAKAKSENEKFFALGKSVDEITKAFADLKRTTEERDVYASEKKILSLEINRLKNTIIALKGNMAPIPELPHGLSGKIVAVDPKYEFVILNIGGREGVLQRGEMLVNRDGQLIGKVQITSVEPTYSVANFLKEGRKGEVIEGDGVITTQ